MSAEMSEFIKVYNDHETYPSMADVAEALGISIKTVRNKAGMLRNLAKSDPTAPKLIMRANVNDNPMSEDSSKFMEHWTAEDCMNELRRIAEIDPEKVVTRNYFRNHSSISESTWNRFFGTFEEFKRQAGIKLSRQQHAHERAIAKHASVDHYRRINIERQDWADKYVRENGNRFKTMLVCSDLHDVEIDLFYLRVLIDTAKRTQPDVIVLAGDIFDLPEFGKYSVDPREWNVVGRIKFAHEQILQPLREACPNTQIDFIEGNHEARMLRQLADATPADERIDAAVERIPIVAMNGLADHLPRQDPVGPLDQRHGQIELSAGQFDWRARFCPDVPPRRCCYKLVEMGLPQRFDRRGGRALPCASQDRPNTR